MRNSETGQERVPRRRTPGHAFAAMAAIAVGAAAFAGCGTYGDPCLRTTDCGSGFVCVEGTCQVDLGDNPGDGGPTSDVVVTDDVPRSSDGASPDVNRDASTDTSAPEGSSPLPDSASTDAPRDAPIDADGAETASFDVPRDAPDGTDVGVSMDATDARAATDASGGNGDGAADVRTDADSGGVIDVTLDAFDAAG